MRIALNNMRTVSSWGQVSRSRVLLLHLEGDILEDGGSGGVFKGHSAELDLPPVHLQPLGSRLVLQIGTVRALQLGATLT